MNKKIIPENFMTVGQLAKKMRTTVRTLQYYDKEGLLSPTAESEGGRRLYTHKDMIKLHQIQSLKSLGFSLDDIKNKLISLDTPKEVVDILNEQSLAIQQKIQQLTETVTAIEALKTEVLQMQVVDFKKYADEYAKEYLAEKMIMTLIGENENVIVSEDEIKEYGEIIAKENNYGSYQDILNGFGEEIKLEVGYSVLADKVSDILLSNAIEK